MHGQQNQHITGHAGKNKLEIKKKNERPADERAVTNRGDDGREMERGEEERRRSASEQRKQCMYITNSCD